MPPVGPGEDTFALAFRKESGSLMPTHPLGSLYHVTKFAVEGISESLRYEVA